MAKSKKEQTPEVVVITQPVVQTVETNQATEKQQTKQVHETNKLTVKALLSMIHYAPKDFKEQNGLISISRPILMSNFNCWKSVYQGSVYSFMQIDEKQNIVRIWDLWKDGQPNRVIKDGLSI